MRKRAGGVLGAIGGRLTSIHIVWKRW